MAIAARATLALPAIEQHQIGPVGAFALGIFLEQPGETPGQHFAHHGVVVAWREILTGRLFDGEFPVGVLHQPLTTGDDHRAHCVVTGDMAVIEDLYPLGATIEAEGGGQAFEKTALGAAFGQALRERLACVAQGMIDELALGAAPWLDKVDPMSCMLGQRALDQFVVLDGVTGQD